MIARPRRILLVLACLALLAVVFAAPATAKKGNPKADTIYINGDIYTVDKQFHRVAAMAIKDGRFLAVGPNAKMKGFIGRNTEVINLKGATIFPGFWDAHMHFSGYGSSLLRVQLAELQKDECLAAVKAAVDATTPGHEFLSQWILGRGWNQTLWTDQSGLVEGMPTAAMLDAVAPNNPVRLTRTDGHATWANTYLLELSGVTKDTPEVPGGKIIRYPDGTPTGVFIDQASSVLMSAPPATEQEIRDGILVGANQLFAFGNTSVADMGGSATHIERMKEMYAEGTMKLRVQQYVSPGSAAQYYAQPLSERLRLFGDRYTINGIKIVDDGAMGSAGAWFLEPYSDNALFGRPLDWVGFPTFGGPYYDEAGNEVLVPTVKQNADKLVEACEPAVKAGFQVAVHAIGDASNRAYLDAVEQMKQDLPELTVDARFRNEHAQCPDLADIMRFKDLGVIPSMQAQHATQDLTMFESRVGHERTVEGGYVWRTFIDAGNVIADGSDASVEVPNPWWGLYSATTRINYRGSNNGEPWYPEQCMTREEALRSFTIWASYAAFEENNRGSIEKGKLADFVVVGYPDPADTDYMTMEARSIHDMFAQATVVGGEVVYTAPGFDF